MEEEAKEALILNLINLHTTKLGEERIKKNLNIETYDVVRLCVDMIRKSDVEIKREGKNFCVISKDF